MKNSWFFPFMLMASCFIYCFIDREYKVESYECDIKLYKDSIKNLNDEIDYLQFLNSQQFDALMRYEEQYIYLGEDPTIE
jgi:hypothetical protein